MYTASTIGAIFTVVPGVPSPPQAHRVQKSSSLLEPGER